jgi:hypothetical protein
MFNALIRLNTDGISQTPRCYASDDSVSAGAFSCRTDANVLTISCRAFTPLWLRSSMPQRPRMHTGDLPYDHALVVTSLSNDACANGSAS